MTFRILRQLPHPRLQSTVLWSELASGVEAQGLAHMLAVVRRKEPGTYLIVSEDDWASTEVEVGPKPEFKAVA